MFCLVCISIICAAFARGVYKQYPEARQIDRDTPYNDRRKMGQFSWTATEVLDRKQVIVNVYVVHKVRG